MQSFHKQQLNTSNYSEILKDLPENVAPMPPHVVAEMQKACESADAEILAIEKQILAIQKRKSEKLQAMASEYTLAAKEPESKKARLGTKSALT